MTSFYSFNSFFGAGGDSFYSYQYTPGNGCSPLEDPSYLADMSFSTQLMGYAETQLSSFSQTLGINPNTGQSYNLLNAYDQVSFISNSFSSFYSQIAESYKKVNG